MTPILVKPPPLAINRTSSEIDGPTRLHGAWLWLARLAWFVIVALALTMLYQMLRVNDWDTWGEWVVQQARPATRPYMGIGAFIRYLIVLEWLGVGISLAAAFLIAWKRSNDWLGLLISMTLVLFALMHVSSDTDKWRFPPNLAFLNDYTSVFLTLFFLGLMLLFFLFPTGRFVPRWSFWLLIVGALAIPGIWAIDTYATVPEDIGWAAFLFTFSFLILTGILAQIYRYRSVSDPVQRQQTKWVVFGFTGIFVWLLWSFLLAERFSAWGFLIQIHLNWLAFTLIPLTIGISILRYHLWDIDILVNRTLVFGALTLLILVLYGLLVGGMALIFQAQIGPGLAVAATAIVALLALPLRQRLQRVINRLMYGDRDDPIIVLSRLGQTLAATGDSADVFPTLVDTIAQSLQLPYVAIWLKRDDSQFELVASHGQSRDSVIFYPISYQGEMIGRLLVSTRAPGESFSPLDERLLNDIARQAGAAAHAVQLTLDLQRSRGRLVTAREEERRRLRRNLHDGLGPQLASFTLKLDAARNLLATESAEADTLLLALRGDVQNAIADVRRLAYDLRPPALDQLGLVPVLCEYAAQHADNDLRITIDAPADLPPLPAAVEVAAYRIVLEALTNCARHAQASACAVQLMLEDQLVIEISDDGRGLPVDYRPGVGMASMRERAEELGGALRVETSPTGGTRVRASIPIPAEFRSS